MRDISPTVSGPLGSLLQRRGVLGGAFGLFLDLALITIGAIVFARLVWTILSPTAFVTTAAMPQASQSSDTFAIAANPDVLERFNPFDRNLAASEAPQVEDAPQTTLNLTIRLLFSSTDPEQSIVRLELPDGSVKRLAVGDTVVQGVTIERILSDRVVLLRRGEREVLYASETNYIDRVTPDGEPFVDPTPQTSIPADEAPAEDLVIEVSRDEVDVDALASQINYRRIADANNIPRLVIFEGSDSALLDQLGLAVDDQLVSVNGYDLGQQSLADLYEELKEAERLDFDVRRGNNSIKRTIVFDN